MRKLRNAEKTLELFLGNVDEIIPFFDDLVVDREPLNDRAKYVFDRYRRCFIDRESAGEVALFLSLNYWSFLEPEQVVNVVINNKLRNFRDFNWKMPQSPMEWLKELCKFTCSKDHDAKVQAANEQLLAIFGNGQPCQLISLNGENLGKRTVSKDGAELLISLGIIPIPDIDYGFEDYISADSLAEAWRRRVRIGYSWGLHDHKGIHC